MTTAFENEESAVHDAPAVSAKKPIDPNRWLVGAVAVLVVAVIALGVLLITDGGDGGSGVADPGSTSSAVFPTGTFEGTNGYSGVEFNEDGTCRHFELPAGWEVPCTYAVRNDVFTEMTFEWPSGAQVPVTFYWDYDGENLTFELWGEDVRPHRAEVYAQVFKKVE